VINQLHNRPVALGVLFGDELPTVHVQIHDKATEEAAGLKKASFREKRGAKIISSFLDPVFPFPVSRVLRL